MRKKEESPQSFLFKMRVSQTCFSASIMVPVPTISNYYKCPNCGIQVPTDYNYCYYCGTALRQPVVLKICPKCKNRIASSSQVLSRMRNQTAVSSRVRARFLRRYRVLLPSLSGLGFGCLSGACKRLFVRKFVPGC